MKFYKKMMVMHDMDGAGGGAGNSDPSGAQQKKENDPPEPKPEDEKKFTQSDVDKMIKDRISREQGKIDKLKKEIEDIKLTAQMTAEEKAKHEREKEIEEFNKMKADLTARELKMTAVEELASKGLPKSFVSLLNMTSEEAMKESIEVLQKEYSAAVNAGAQNKINDVLKQNGVPNTNNKPASKGLTKADVMKMTYNQRVELFTKDPDAYKKIFES